MDVINENEAAARTPAPDEASPALNLRQQKLLDALVADPDISAACKAAGIVRATAYRWLKEPSFRDELARQRDVVMVEALDGVKPLAAQAMSELARLLKSKDDRLRRMICNDLLSHAIRVRELEDIERRLVALEKAAKDNERRRNRNIPEGLGG